MTNRLFKDEVLYGLGSIGNVAQFVSFGPDLVCRYELFRGSQQAAGTAAEYVELLLARSGSGSLNVRSFKPDAPQGNEFVYGLVRLDQVLSHLRRLAAGGFYTIVNETVDVDDGGVSGVVHGDAIEFAPGDTPRAVEKPGIASFPRELGLSVLREVYGFGPDLDFSRTSRVEFSIHPMRVGVRNENTLLWELEDAGRTLPPTPAVTWPNRFSELLGDKTFGLLLAALVDLPVPRTLVLNRKVAPFSFGNPTGSRETWLRTMPRRPSPGEFTTSLGWQDPFKLLQKEDASGEGLAGVLAQDSVASEFSGAARLQATGEVRVEGVTGWGDEFMLGTRPPEPLPTHITAEVRSILEEAWHLLGVGAIEWAHDGRRAWVLQLHQGRDRGHGQVIVPGSPGTEVSFDVSEGLESLRALVENLSGDVGVVLEGQVGVTSHFGDVLRRAKVPARLRARD